MLNLRSISLVCLAIALTGWLACADNATTTTQVMVPGNTSSSGAGGDDSGTATSSGGSGGATSSSSSGAATSSSGSGGATSSSSGGATSSSGSGDQTDSGPGGQTDSGGAGDATDTDAGQKIVLFDGTTATFNSWASVRTGQNNPWKNNGDGSMTVITGTGDIQSKMKFQDLFVHVEYMTPVFQATDTAATGQNRGNSGVYLKGSYEMQVLDTYGLPPAIDGCGAVYSIKAPLVVACNMGGVWNTYEIEFKANVCDANGMKTTNARIVSAHLNGMLVQQDVEVPHTTTSGLPESCGPAGIVLQDHTSFKPVSYRNIWVTPR